MTCCDTLHLLHDVYCLHVFCEKSIENASLNTAFCILQNEGKNDFQEVKNFKKLPLVEESSSPLPRKKTLLSKCIGERLSLLYSGLFMRDPVHRPVISNIECFFFVLCKRRSHRFLVRLKTFNPDSRLQTGHSCNTLRG